MIIKEIIAPSKLKVFMRIIDNGTMIKVIPTLNNTYFFSAFSLNTPLIILVGIISSNFIKPNRQTQFIKFK